MSGGLTYEMRIFTDYWIIKADERCDGKLKLTLPARLRTRGGGDHKQMYG
jgi:hypothetical protein